MDESGDLFADPHKILNTCKNYFCQLLNVFGACVVKQTETHRAELFVLDLGASEVGVPAELIQAEGEILRSETYELIMLIWNKEELSQQWKESIIMPIHGKGDKTNFSNYRGIILLLSS
jgi:hypothetical protein